MGDISIIARRLDDSNYAQYGWGSNEGYFYDSDHQWYYVTPVPY